MKLGDFPRNQIEAAMKMKGFTYTSLAEKVGRAVQTVHKAVNGTSSIDSPKLNDEIVQALQPELSIIHQAFLPATLKSELVNEELTMSLAGHFA
jgi:lambda repressor-like predicted transcriptional regulator